jgi:hypothetical protein
MGYWVYKVWKIELWAWSLEVSHYDRPSRETVVVHGQRFQILSLAFENFTLCPAKGSNSYILLASYFQPISLECQQSLAIQSHGLSTWTAKVWSGLQTLVCDRRKPEERGKAGCDLSTRKQLIEGAASCVYPPLSASLEEGDEAEEGREGGVKSATDFSPVSWNSVLSFAVRVLRVLLPDRANHPVAFCATYRRVRFLSLHRA